MKLLFKFLALPLYKKILLVKVMSLLVMMRLIVSLFPFQIIKQLLDGQTKNFIANQNSQFLQELKWAIDAVSGRIPFTKTCLVRSLAMHVFLIRNGFESTLHIGVAKNENKKLLAHAWIESNGKVLIDETAKNKTYTSLLSIGTSIQ